MKPIIQLLIFIFLVNTTIAQESKGYVGIGIGASLPVGQIGSTSIEDYFKYGYLKTGISYNLDCQYQLYRWIGLSASLYSSKHEFDVENFLKSSEFSNNGNAIKAEKPAIVNSYLAGIVLKKQNFPVYLKAMFGVSSVQSVEISSYDKQNLNSTTIKQSEPVWGYSSSYSIGSYFKLYKRLGMNLSVTLLSCKSVPTKVPMEYNHQAINQTYSSFLDPDGIYFMNAQAGLGYLLE